jgi:hypothetical protein
MSEIPNTIADVTRQPSPSREAAMTRKGNIRMLPTSPSPCVMLLAISSPSDCGRPGPRAALLT